METEQGEQHAVATINDPSTPASSNFLEKLPTEILFMITSQLGHLYLTNATLVSKRLRSVVIPRLFKKIRLSGSLRKLACDMRSILGGKFGYFMQLILSYAKVVTIRFEPSRSTNSGLSARRIAIISEFISKLSSVDVIAFDLRINVNSDRNLPRDFDDSYVETAMDLLCNSPKWNGPKTVLFPGQKNLPTFSSIMRQFAPDSVKAVHLPGDSGTRYHSVLQSTFPSLEGLEIEMTGFTVRSRTLACMDSRLLRRLYHDLPHLESLVLDQVDPRRFVELFGLFKTKSTLPNLDRTIERLISQLKDMPSLRRFAFSLLIEWMASEYQWESRDERKSRLSRLDPPPVTSEQDEGPYWLKTNAERDEWYSRAVTRILDGVPQLKELCVKATLPVAHQGPKFRIQGDPERDATEA
ncbi:hypothetical protein FACUT_5551 [Fusarium acutatum]|uniref:F-box domain-containing protein n=1 Tax=Fusarium acutatum TaxID=78861 RepID=A0A8H4JVA4_9HYPO|nr:hypothetical protein FACUT_5551 [Fusarium acutatum]